MIKLGQIWVNPDHVSVVFDIRVDDTPETVIRIDGKDFGVPGTVDEVAARLRKEKYPDPIR